jgi:TolB-like protein
LQHKRAALLAMMSLIALTMVVAYYAYWRYAGSTGRGTIRSIAVLPFANTGGNPDAEYLSDGISASLINSLSQLPGLKVIARSSSFQYKGKEGDLQQVAKALGVEAVLTGRVLERGDSLQISAELVNASDKTQVWGEQYNRTASDLLQVQSEISREISAKLRVRLTAGEQQQLARRETANPRAYELLLQGRFYNNKGGTEDRKKLSSISSRQLQLIRLTRPPTPKSRPVTVFLWQSALSTRRSLCPGRRRRCARLWN